MACGKIKWRFADQPEDTQPNRTPDKLTDSNTFVFTMPTSISKTSRQL